MEQNNNSTQENQPQQAPGQTGAQGKKSVLGYFMSVKSDTLVNQGFNKFLAECVNYFDGRYSAYLKQTGKSQAEVTIEDPEGENITFQNKEEIFKHCCKVSVGYVETHFKEPMESYKKCRDLCAKQYDTGFVNYFYRESCNKECRKSMEVETQPIVQEFFKDKRIYNKE